MPVACRVLGPARRPYHRWPAGPVSDAELAGAHRADALFDAHRDDPEFGHRFLLCGARVAGQPMADQNLTLSSRQAADGLPGDGINPRYARTCSCRSTEPTAPPPDQGVATIS